MSIIGSNPETYEMFNTTAVDASGDLIQPANVTGYFSDYKDHVDFIVNITNIDPDYTFDSFWVNVSLLSGSTNDARNKRFKVNTSLVATANGYNTTMMTISNLGSADIPNLPYEFLNHEEYTIQYTAFFKSSDPNNNTVFKLGHIQEFTYYSNPVTLVEDVDVSEVLQTGDDIIITGLYLDLSGNENDSTTPEYLTFTFQRTDPDGNNDEPDENYIVRKSYDPSGNYTLLDNTLPNNHSYFMTVDAQWDLGYTTSMVYGPIYVVTRPKIENIRVLSLYTRDPLDEIATIDLSGNDLSGNLWFEFRGTSNVVVATVGGVNGLTYAADNSYSFILSDISGNAIVHDISYNVVVKQQYDNISFDDLGVSVPVYGYSDPEPVTFALTEPNITDIVVNNLYIRDTDDNIATITVDHEAYQLYAPYDASGILFVFYDASGDEVARTIEYTFLNDSSDDDNLYNIKLDEITADTLLTNGTPYNVKAQVTLVDHSGGVELRLSEAFPNVTFTQNLAPVLPVEILNTWELVTDQQPESNRTNFLGSPAIGISGHFSKNAQFGSQYLKHLDTASTKFKLEYKVSTSLNVLVTDWTPVTKASLVLQGTDPVETLESAAARAIVDENTLSTVSSGEYANIPGTDLGTYQGDIVFYIPQKQVGVVNAFVETHKVEVRVTVIDSSSPYLWGGLTESDSTESQDLHIISKIDEYDFTTGAASEPWNSVNTYGNLLINIPVSWNSEYSHSVEVSYKYSTGDSYCEPVEFLKAYYPSMVSFVVDPTLGTTLYYRVRYVVTNLNLDAPATTTDGIITEKNVPNKFFPESSDYDILNADYATFNNDEESNITFDLSFNIDPENRLDGVNVYFTSTDSSIAKVRIGSYTTGGTKTITLLSTTGTTGGFLQTMNSSGVVGFSSALWLNYDSANISFEAFRDARVNSTNASYSSSNGTLNPVAYGYYVESGEQSTFGIDSHEHMHPIWNVPVLTPPGDGGSITLSGGVINIVDPSSNHYIEWTSDDSESFTYDVKVTRGVSDVIVDDTDTDEGKDISGNSYIIPIDLVNVYKYTVEIRKVFNGSDEENRERSDPVTVVFHTVKVDTSDMDITVENPSNTQYVNLSWNEPDFVGSSVTDSGEESSSFENNIHEHYIKYRDSSFNLLTILDPSSNLIERIVSPATKKQYTLPVQAIGTLYEFVMYVEADVKYTVDGVVSASNSVAFQVPLTETTTESKYIVSSIPSVGVIPDSDDVNIIPVLVQGSSNPVLLLNLNANGLEDEGFISVVVILTQDGSDSKPDGEQVFLVFPDPSGTAFSFTNSVDTTTSGSGGDPRLAGGDESTSAPRNIDNTVLSTDPSNNTYVLTIGSVDEETGRYGLSTLMMPPTDVSGFVDDSVVNYMVILTTRRGTDIGVGEFTYEAIPSVTEVYIDASGGEYYVHFTLAPA